MINLGTIGKLAVVIGGDTSQLKEALADSEFMLKKHEASVRGAINTLGKFAAVAASAGAAIVAGLVAKSMEAVDAQLALARQLRATTAGLEGMKRAAALNNVEEEKMIAATKRLDVAIGEAIQGVAEYKDAFDALGISAADLSRMDVDQRIAAINEALRKNVPVAEQAAVAGALFGTRMGAAIMQISGGDLEQARREMVALGVAVNEIDAETIDRAGDALSVIGKVAEGAANRITVALAPVIEALATKIYDAAVQSEGFKSSIVSAIDNMVWVVGKAMDVWRGWEVIFKGVQLAGQLAAGVMFKSWSMLASGIATIVEGILSGVNTVIEGLNRIPGVNIDKIIVTKPREFADTLAEIADSIFQTAGTTRQELEKIAGEPLPSEGLWQLYEEAKAMSEKLSKEAIAARSALGGGGPGGGKVDKEAQARLEALRDSLRTEHEQEVAAHEKRLKEMEEFRKKGLISEQEFNSLREAEEYRHQRALGEIRAAQEEDWIKEQERRKQALETLRESLLTEEELEAEHYAKKLEQLAEFREQEMITEDEYRAMRERAEEDHEKKMTAIKEKGMSDMLKMAERFRKKDFQSGMEMLANMTAGLARESKTMFEINKIAAMANVVLKGIEAVQSAYAWGAKIGGPPMGIAAAAAAGLFHAQQLNAIRSQQFQGGGGAAPSVAGTTAAPPVSPVGETAASAGSGQTVLLRMEGEVFTKKTVRNLIGQINESLEEGGRIVLV